MSSVLPLPQGGSIVSGVMQFPGLQGDYRLARLFPNGTRDPGFYTSGLGGGRITAWNDGYYVAGNTVVRRVHANGENDMGFSMSGSYPLFAPVQGGDYHVFPDGRVLMSGAHILHDTARGFDGMYNLIWFTNTGYLDTTRIHRLSNGVLYDFKELPDGKFLCSGNMTTYEGQPVSRIFRIHPDGALDPSFTTEFDPWGAAYEYVPLEDGKVLVGGFFRRAGQSDTLCLLRLLPDGGIDPGFSPPAFEVSFTPSGIPYVVGILPVGDRFVVTGVFDRINGEPRGGIALLDADGNLLDDAFTGDGCGAYVYTVPSGSTTIKYIAHIVPAPDGSYYIHGGYHGYDDGTTNDPLQRMVSRLHGLNVGMQEHDAPRMRLYPNPASTQVTVELAPPASAAATQGMLLLRDALGREVRRQRLTAQQQVFPVAGSESGVYLLELWGAGERLAAERLVLHVP